MIRLCVRSNIKIWDDPAERGRMLQEIRAQGRVRNRITRFRKCCGEVVDTFYSADLIELDGRECFLAASEDLPERAELQLPVAPSRPARRSALND
jgi:hypothetical protein